MAEVYVQFRYLILCMVIAQGRAGSLLPELTVSTFQEEDVTLSCSSINQTNPKSCYRIKWTRYYADSKQWRDIFVWPKTAKDGERLKRKVDGNGQEQLVLKNIQKSDEGLYGCEIWQGWDVVLARNISLKVKDCKVLPAVKAVTGTHVKLDIPENITSGLYNISWAVLKGGKPEPVDPKRTEVNFTSLAIQSVILADSGWYRCSYMTEQTWRCFDIHVLVQGPSTATTVTTTATTTVSVTSSTTYQVRGTGFTYWKEENSEALRATVPSVSVGILVICALVGFVVYRRRRTRRGTQDIWTRTTGPLESMDGYEAVDFPHLQGTPNQRINSIYHNDNENICTSD